MPPKIAVITGPTATGKTRLGVLLAQRLGGEVVSADSMQLYRGMDIGTAKPTPEEMQGVPHHLIDVAEPWENWSAARYVEAAGAACRDILARGRLPIVVGGTGLYIDSLVRGLGFAAGANLNPQGVSMFEPIHGSAPKYKGQNVINPIATILSGGLLLENIGEPELGALVERAVEETLRSGAIRTRDMGGGTTTSQVGDAIAAKVLELAGK